MSQCLRKSCAVVSYIMVRFCTQNCVMLDESVGYGERWAPFVTDLAGISAVYRFAKRVCKLGRTCVQTASTCHTYSATYAVSKMLSQSWSVVRM
jgi:hypothetical protein